MEKAILKSLIEDNGTLKDGYGYELNKKVIEAYEELKPYSKYGLLVEVSEEVSNENVLDFMVYANEEEETYLQYCLFSFKATKKEIA